MRNRALRYAERCVGFTVLVTTAGVAYAQDTRVGMIASAGASVETNPYNTAGTSGASVAATAELRPTINIRDGNTTIDVNGLAQFRQFLRRYGLEDNYGVDARISSKQSDWLTLRGIGVFSYSEGGFNGYGRPGLTPVGPDPTTTQDVSFQPTPVSLADVNILGQRTRITSVEGGLGADVQLSARSTLSVDGNARAMRFKTFVYNDYTLFSGELRYSYAVDELTKLGIIGSVGLTDYLDLRQGDADVKSVLATVERRVGERWTISLGAGAAFSRIDGRFGSPTVNFSTFSGRIRVCDTGQYTRFCLGGERSPQPAASGNIRVSTAVTADYSLRLSQRDRFTLGASYARTGRGHQPATALPAIEFASASGRYDNDLTKRVTAFVTASAAKVFSSVSPRRANLGAAIGVQVRIGAAR